MVMDYSTYKFLIVEVKDGVATITMNRPDVLNAVNWALHAELDTIFEDVAEDERVKAVVITGAGRAFCSGGDVKMFDRIATEGKTWSEDRETQGRQFRGKGLLASLLDLPKPIIAAVNGHAAGLGAQIALFCDMVIAADDAKFSDKHVSAGLSPGDGGTVIWPMLVGPLRAKQYLMTGDVCDAKEADRIGLVNEVVPLKELMPRAKAWAKRLAEGPSLAIAGAKLPVNKTIKLAVATIMGGTGPSEQFCATYSEDHKEAARAFKEKRKPVFKGR